MTFAAPSSGRDQLRLAQIGAAGDRLDGGSATFGGRIKGGHAHRDDLDRVGRLDGGQRVAGVDRAHEGVGGFDADDVGNLRHVQQCGNARQHVFAEAAGGGQHMAVAAALDDIDQQRGKVFGAGFCVGGGIRKLYLADAGQLGGGCGRTAAGRARDQHVDVCAEFACGGNGVEGGGLEAGVVVFGNDEDGHGFVS